MRIASDDAAIDRRLLTQSRMLSAAFLALFCLVLLLDVLIVSAFLLRLSAHAGMSGASFVIDPDVLPPYVTPIGRYSVPQSLLISLLLGLRLFPGLLILWHLRSLFRLYGQGQLFGVRSTAQIRRIAIALLAYAAVPVVTHLALFWALISPRAFRWEIRQLDALVVGLVLFTVARVMQAAHAIERDRDGFV
jgi:hypothetical protein